jgi:signal transduction histidine kinase
LLAWTTSVDVLGAVGVSPIRPHVAAAVVALAVAMVFLAERPSPVVEWMTRVLSVTVVFAGALAFWQYVSPTSLSGLSPFTGTAAGFPDALRMEPASALTLVLLGSALALYDLRSERLHHAVEMLVMVAAVIAFEALFEHAFGIDSLYGLVGTFPSAPALISLSLLVLSVGAASLRPHRGWFRILVDTGAAGVTVRRLIPVSVAAPFLVGWLTYLGVTGGFLSPASGLTLLVSAMGVLLLFAVGWTTRELHRIDQERMALLESERRARDEAEKASRAKSDFLGVMSHELRTPLNSVVAYAELLEREVKGPLNPDQLRYVERVRVGARHLRSMIDEILEFTRARRGVVKADLRRVDAVELAREALAVSRHEADPSAIELCPQLPTGTLEIRTDPEKVLHVLVNFLGNALKFTERGRVGLRLRREEGRVVYEVWDTGPGIPREHRERIFQEFTQLHPDGTGRRGAGLGLAICRGYAETVGGRVEVDSWVGRGSVFRLVLPHTGSTEAGMAGSVAPSGFGGPLLRRRKPARAERFE